MLEEIRHDSAPRNTSITSYQRTSIIQTEYFEIVSCTWKLGDVSPMHGHGWSECFALIESGSFLNTTDSGIAVTPLNLVEGQVIHSQKGARHEMRCTSDVGKTFHIYLPKIKTAATKNNFKSQPLQMLKAELPLTLMQSGMPWSELTRLLTFIEEHSVATHSPYFMNQLFSGVNPESFLAEELITKTKSTMATFEASPVFSLVEVEVVQKLGELIGWRSDESEGVAVPGGSAANFMAIHCARHRLQPDYKTKGMLASINPLHVYVSDEAHYSFKKACAVLGLGTDNLIAVKTDMQGRMLAQDLEQKINRSIESGATPLMACATAGTTVLGAFDPIGQMADVCEKFGVWLHVDGAWGGPILFSQSSRHLLSGVERADSMTFDAHKLLGAPLTCSFFLTRHGQNLLESNDVAGGEYLFHAGTEAIDRGRLSWQCGRRADAVNFWTLWKSHGTDGLSAFVDRLLSVKDELVQWILNEPRLELLVQPEFLNVCVRIKPPDPQWSLKVRNALRERDLAMVNYSSDREGNPFLRMILANSRTDFAVVKQILTWALEIESA
jgi:glutamate/tyrosine decarboxylase-like PLP-dependent enzyme/quercetin dioxygenase-like cupin family protein